MLDKYPGERRRGKLFAGNAFPFADVRIKSYNGGIIRGVHRDVAGKTVVEQAICRSRNRRAPSRRSGAFVGGYFRNRRALSRTKARRRLGQ